MQRSTILVTGASGFIGRAVCRSISDLGHVLGVVRHAQEEQNIANLDFLIADLTEDIDWSDHLKDVQVIVHCAARVHILKEFANDPLTEFRAVNVNATISLAQQAVASGVSRFIFLSSIGVLGAHTAIWSFAAASEASPQSAYAISKYEAEVALRKISLDTGLEVVIIRPPLVYGPDAPGNFAALIRALSSGVPLPLARATQNRRSFVFIDNLTDLIRACLFNPAAANQTLLVSDGEDLSTADLLTRLGNALEQPVRLFPIPITILRVMSYLLGRQDMFQRLFGSLAVDINHTKFLLDWKPPVSVDDALMHTSMHWKLKNGR
jgi:nucleoside-diphosphate-sugar epimerase